MDDAKEKPAGVVAYLSVRENPADCICQSQALNSAVLVVVIAIVIIVIFGVGVEDILKR